jgi:hypothetical protein
MKVKNLKDLYLLDPVRQAQEYYRKLEEEIQRGNTALYEKATKVRKCVADLVREGIRVEKEVPESGRNTDEERGRVDTLMHEIDIMKNRLCSYSRQAQGVMFPQEWMEEVTVVLKEKLGWFEYREEYGWVFHYYMPAFPLVCKNKGQGKPEHAFCMGPFNVVLPTYTGEYYRANPIKGAIINGDRSHPHVIHKSQLCLGTAEVPLRTALTNGRFRTAQLIVKTLLSDYPEDTAHTLIGWHPAALRYPDGKPADDDLKMKLYGYIPKECTTCKKWSMMLEEGPYCITCGIKCGDCGKAVLRTTSREYVGEEGGKVIHLCAKCFATRPVCMRCQIALPGLSECVYKACDEYPRCRIKQRLCKKCLVECADCGVSLCRDYRQMVGRAPHCLGCYDKHMAHRLICASCAQEKSTRSCDKGGVCPHTLECDSKTMCHNCDRLCYFCLRRGCPRYIVQYTIEATAMGRAGYGAQADNKYWVCESCRDYVIGNGHIHQSKIVLVPGTNWTEKTHRKADNDYGHGHK